MRYEILNFEPDDNYRVYYRDKDTRRLYCWLCYGPRERWAFYSCTRDGEPSHEIAQPADMPKPLGGQHPAPVQALLDDVAVILEETDSATLDAWEREQYVKLNREG